MYSRELMISTKRSFSIAFKMIFAVSAALETCPGASRPWAFWKFVCVAPASSAQRFISETNAEIEPFPKW